MNSPDSDSFNSSSQPSGGGNDRSESERSLYDIPEYRLPQDILADRESAVPQPPSPTDEGPDSVLGLTLLAWLLIAGLALFIFGTNFYGQYYVRATSTEASQAEKMQFNLQSKIQLGLPGFLARAGAPPNPNQLDDALTGLNSGPLELRFGYTILVSEIKGPAAAAKELRAIRRKAKKVEFETRLLHANRGKTDASPDADEADEKGEEPNPEGEEADRGEENKAFQVTETQEALAETLQSIFRSSARGEFDEISRLPQQQQQLLQDELGWIGRLALFPEGTADAAGRQAVMDEAIDLVQVLAIFSLVALVVGVAALVVSFIVFMMGISGTLRFQLRTANRRSGIYAETFAVWMLIFVGSSIVLSILQGAVELPTAAMVLLQLFVFFGSLIALAYPMIRGVPSGQVANDVGLDFRHSAREVLFGFVGYLAILPLVVVGFVGVLLVGSFATPFLPSPAHEFVSQNVSGHPIQDEIMSGNTLIIVGVFLTACVAAPIVEEITFRGVLYQHLRGSSRWLPRLISVGLGCSVSALIFAVIHPQGLVGVPVLFCLGAGFALVREWRGSLVAPMTMHAIHNSIVTCVLLNML